MRCNECDITQCGLTNISNIFIHSKQSNALLYNRKRSIGRPKPFQRIHKDSAESLSGGSDIVTWHSVKEGEIREGTEDLDADDINMDEEIIMENEISTCLYLSFLILKKGQ